MLSFQRKTEEEESVCIFGLSGLWGLHKAMNHFVWAPEMLSLLSVEEKGVHLPASRVPWQAGRK